MNIVAYKNRTLDYQREVRVHRNLNKTGGKFYTIIQDGRVVAHATELELKHVSFRVSLAGQARVRLEKQKNVHAFLKGWIIVRGGYHTCVARVTYNPYTDPGFMIAGQEVRNALVVQIGPNGVFAYDCFGRGLERIKTT